MNVSIFLSVFVFGIIIGSFLNVVILRYNTGMTIGGRSACFSCNKTLVWYELVPILSYCFLRGKCSACKSKISVQYPLVELATGLFFALIFFYFLSTPYEIIYYWVIFSLLIVIFVYDIRHTIIPDGLVYSFIVLSLAHVFFLAGWNSFYPPELWNLLAGPILFAPFALLWLFSKGTWMGFGDAKLALGIGFAVGLRNGISAIFFAFWIGAVVSLLYLAFLKIRTTVKNSALSANGKQLTIKSEIPFAPYLIIGLLIVLFFHTDILHLKDLFGI